MCNITFLIRCIFIYLLIKALALFVFLINHHLMRLWYPYKPWMECEKSFALLLFILQSRKKFVYFQSNQISYSILLCNFFVCKKTPWLIMFKTSPIRFKCYVIFILRVARIYSFQIISEFIKVYRNLPVVFLYSFLIIWQTLDYVWYLRCYCYIMIIYHSPMTFVLFNELQLDIITSLL